MLIEMIRYYRKCNKSECENCSKRGKDGECTEYMFKISQYEEYSMLFRFSEHINARYIEQEEPDYEGNPLIEALPPYLNIEQLLNILEENPRYSSSERERDDEYRINALLRLKKKYFFFFSKHLEMYNKLIMVIRGGYEGRNILTPSFIERVNFTSKLLNDRWLKNKMSQLSCISSYSDTAMDGWSLIGMSGEGKSVGFNKLLTTFPQVIVHTEYGGRKFLFYQLVWIKIDCASKASIKQICIKFFEEVDKVLGTEYLRKFGSARASTDNMIIAMAHITQIHGLGALIIDEIQHLATSKVGIEEVLNFLVTLKNEMKIPIIYIGTYKATKSILGRSYTQARRASGMGEVIWSPMPKEEEWNNFIKRMWKFQWTKKENPLTEGLSNLFYEKTMGITDRAIKLYIAAQAEAIMSNIEIITEGLINNIAENNMPLTSDMIKALRERNPTKLSAYDDLKSFEIEEYIEELIKQKQYQKQLKQERENEKYIINQKKQEIENELVLLMIQKGISEKLAETVANSVVKEFGIDKEIVFLQHEAGKKINEIKKNKKSSVKGSKDDVEDKKANTDDIKSGYEKYKEKGFIRSLD